MILSVKLENKFFMDPTYTSLQWKHGVLITGLPGKSQSWKEILRLMGSSAVQ